MTLHIRDLGLKDYQSVWKDMQEFTLERNENTDDELWLVEHPPVYTLGLNGNREHIIKENKIPVIAVDRGGQVTYHGPGQIVIYILCDLNRQKLSVHKFINAIEQSIIDLLASCSISAKRKPGAPGVYVDNKKIAALGLRIKKGRSYHGLSLNVNMDLEPFKDINPCGYPELEVIQLYDLGIHEDLKSINSRLVEYIKNNLGYNDASRTSSE